MIPFPEKKYSVIYADPPWNYAAGGKTRNVERHYRTMKPEDIYSLPVQDIAEDDCLLFLWATFPNLDVALETIRRWGFQYKTAAFVWVKRNRKSPSWFWGLGNFMYGKESLCKYRSRKPEGVAVELADAVIRIADLCGHLGIDLEEVIEIKMAYNEGRPYKHGKKF